ncbi:hypothetical protein HanPI659440_Chr03g0133001 [Helianthus annuus]|nr:hypothetical protein HanPI659440_Chr03g0133001 [Helianthus annuus]
MTSIPPATTKTTVSGRWDMRNTAKGSVYCTASWYGVRLRTTMIRWNRHTWHWVPSRMQTGFVSPIRWARWHVRTCINKAMMRKKLCKYMLR